MRPAFWSVAIQAIGSAATIGAALLVASTMGLAAQGQFGLLRSWNDALVTLAVLGLPQGLLHLRYRESVPAVDLRTWVLRYLFVLTGLCAVLAAGLIWALSAGLWSGPVAPWMLAVLVAAVPPAAGHLLWRSLALREMGIVRYAAITATPALLIFGALLPVCFAGSRSGLVWTLFASAVLSASLSGWMVYRATRHGVPGAGVRVWSRATLWSVGIETGAQAVLTALTPALVLTTVGWLGASLSEVGLISLGLHAYQLFAVAAAYVAPLVYDRAANLTRPPMIGDIKVWVRAQATSARMLGVAAVAATAVVLASRFVPAGDALAMLVLMALAGTVSMGVRLLVTLMLARGAFRPLSYQALVRLLIVGGTTALLVRHMPATLAVPIALGGAELVLLVWLVRMLRDGAAVPATASSAAPP